MGPQSNSELFGHVTTGDTLARLDDEVARRMMIAEVLGDLSTQFESADAARHVIAEPTLPMSLYALSTIQRTRLGISGFNPVDAINFQHTTAQVLANSAPVHDTFMNENGATYATRGIRFDTERTAGTGSEIEMYGLNLFIPEADITKVVPESSAMSAFVVVGEHGRAKTADSYIAGMTPVIAVRSKKTGDAKVYAFFEVREGELDFEDERTMSSGAPVIKDSKAYVRLPDGQVQGIEVLTGEALRQAANEFGDVIIAIRENPNQLLSDNEQQIARQLPYTSS